MLNFFSQELKQKINQDNSLRPFVCDGDPLNCRIFIVGFNPATKMEKDFIQFWSSDIGFDKKSWLQQYVKERKEMPLKEGQKRRNEYSNTRRRIEWLCSELKTEIPLETNIYHKPTKTVGDLSMNDRNIEVFKFLVTNIKPKILFLHGNDAKKAIEKLLLIKLQNDEFTECIFSGVPLKIIAKKHLSRGWSEDATIEFADRLIKELQN